MDTMVWDTMDTMMKIHTTIHKEAVLTPMVATPVVAVVTMDTAELSTEDIVEVEGAMSVVVEEIGMGSTITITQTMVIVTIIEEGEMTIMIMIMTMTMIMGIMDGMVDGMVDAIEETMVDVVELSMSAVLVLVQVGLVAEAVEEAERQHRGLDDFREDRRKIQLTSLILICLCYWGKNRTSKEKIVNKSPGQSLHKRYNIKMDF